MKVNIKFKKDSPFEGKTDDYRNVTEIHYNYREGHKLGEDRIESDFVLPSVAFESNIHKIGITQQIVYIEEFETELEKEKAKSF